MRVSPARASRTALIAAVTLAALALPSAALADAPRLAACEDLLVTIAPSGTAGDARAAAVTAQALVADVPGWESVTWSVPAETELRDVLALGTDGSTRSLGARRSGSADGVLELGFCGTLGTGSPAETVVDDDGGEPQIDPEPAPQPQPTSEPSSTETGAQDLAGSADDAAAGHDHGRDTDTQRASTGDRVSAAAGDDDEPAVTEPTTVSAEADEDDIAAVVPAGLTAGPYDTARRAALTTSTPASVEVAPIATSVAATDSFLPATATFPVSEEPGTGAAPLAALVAGLIALTALVLAASRRRPNVEVLA